MHQRVLGSGLSFLGVLMLGLCQGDVDWFTGLTQLEVGSKRRRRVRAEIGRLRYEFSNPSKAAPCPVTKEVVWGRR